MSYCICKVLKTRSNFIQLTCFNITYVSLFGCKTLKLADRMVGGLIPDNRGRRGMLETKDLDKECPRPMSPVRGYDKVDKGELDRHPP